MTPINKQTLQDGSFISNVAVPNASNSANSAIFDLIQPMAASDNYRISYDWQAMPNLVANTNVKIVLNHSATNNVANFVAIPELAAIFINGQANGIAAGGDSIKLPISTLEFIQASLTSTNVANSSTANVVLSLKF